ncbi:MAG: hypothetical protein ABFD50_16550 [Smithella sp.]
MSTVIPDGENIKRAIKWVSINFEENENQPVKQLVEKAIFKFDLSPKDAEFLAGFFRNHKTENK